MPTETKLIDQICRRIAQPVSPAIHALTDALLATYREAIQAILFYGSCLRTGDDRGGLVDLYVLVDRYRTAEPRQILAALNKLLPPNVFYIEVPFEDRVVRAKYAVLSLTDLKNGTSRRWYHSYIWGRFAQPIGLIYVRDEQVAMRVQSALAQAVLTFISRVLPVVPSPFTARDLWRQGLSLSYRAELRAERPEKLASLFDVSRDYYENITHTALQLLPSPVAIRQKDGVYYYASTISDRQHLICRVDWMVRCWQGKLLSILRLLKGLLTFRGGINYVLWKIERHSGVKINVSPRLKRYPLVATCVIFWRLYRRGAYR